MKKILILGSGAGGTMVAAKLHRLLSNTESRLSTKMKCTITNPAGCLSHSAFTRLRTV